MKFFNFLFLMIFVSTWAEVSFSKETSKDEVQKNSEKPEPPSNIRELGDRLFEELTSDSFIDPQKKEKNCTLAVPIKGAIGPSSLDTLERALEKTVKENCRSLMLLINTPGGNLLSTRKMVEAILGASVPVLCLIYPSGAHAGSAGAIIMQACHVSGAVLATNIGAATPILGSGKDISKDLRKKMINDAVSWLDSLTSLRKRNKKFGREIVTEAKALSGLEAQKIGAIDFYGESMDEFLLFAKGRKTQIREFKNQTVEVGAVEMIELGARYQLISFITDPQMVYLLFIGSLLLIYFEITHPGTLVPGVLGAIGLVISLTGMHKLNFVWGGLFLILLGVIFMVLEAFVSGFGILGAAGAVSFIVGSFFLFDPSKTGGVDIPAITIILASLFFVLTSMGLAYLAYTALRKKRTSDLTGEIGEVAAPQSESKGLMEINGEIWKYVSKEPLKKGDRVRVLCYKKMVFEVAKVKGE